MLAIKPAAMLLMLGVGGLLGVQAPQRADDATAATAVAATTQESTLPDPAALRAALETALNERIRADLDDQGAQLVLGDVVQARSSLRSLEARGRGVVSIPGAREIPVEVTGVYDLVDGRLESVDYIANPVETDLSNVDRAVRAAIATRIADRIAADFVGQQVDFALIEVESVEYGRHRTQLQGAGVTDFGPEGQAYTPFTAVLDKHTGDLLELRYELLQEGEGESSLTSL
jgi:hypothetical protein